MSWKWNHANNEWLDQRIPQPSTYCQVKKPLMEDNRLVQLFQFFLHCPIGCVNISKSRKEAKKPAPHAFILATNVLSGSGKKNNQNYAMNHSYICFIYNVSKFLVVNVKLLAIWHTLFSSATSTLLVSSLNGKLFDQQTLTKSEIQMIFDIMMLKTEL